MPIGEAAAAWFSAAAPAISDSSFRSVPTAPAAAAASSLGVEGGEQKGVATMGSFVHALFDVTLGDVKKVAGTEGTTGTPSDGNGRLRLTKNASWLESNKSGNSSCNQAK
jgi:hypothetical protein